MKRLLSIGIILLFIGMNIPSTGTTVDKSSTIPYDGKTLYAGGSGPNNYTKIQDAIDDASDGDTVFVFNGTYYENVVVNKSIDLIGEDKNTTIIDGNRYVINITADEVTISGFTIQDYTNGSHAYIGIFIRSDHNIISGNILTGNVSHGIEMYQSESNIISNNIITRVYDGIVLSFDERNNNISGNIIKDCEAGIILVWYTNNNSIFGNTLTNNTWGITTAMFNINGIISKNNISDSYTGIIALNCFNYKITKNNFIDNFVNAQFAYFLAGALRFGFEYNSLRDIRTTIKWGGNYWNRPRSFPKPIFGRLPPSGMVPWFHFDLNPAQEPYDIEV